MTSTTGRTEKRNRQAIAIELWTLTQRPDGATPAATENVSAHGARIVTGNALRPSSYLFVVKPGTVSRLEARVVYCHPLGKGTFGVGLRFQENVWAYWPRSIEAQVSPEGDSQRRGSD